MANIVKEQASCDGVFHVQIRQDSQELMDAICVGLASAQAAAPQRMSAQQLLDLGSIWHIPHRQKAVRISNKQGSSTVLRVQKGDCLRIHTAPRRYRQVYQYDWNLTTSTLVVGRGGDDDWCVLYKPAHIPVHALVDNARETLVGSLLQANTSSLQRVWVPQRLDIDTSGLLVVATSARFASYYAELLRTKTRQALSAACCSAPVETQHAYSGIRKGYRCLVQQLETAVPFRLQANQILCHYMEQTKGTPKVFVTEVPAAEGASTNRKKYLQCRLRIVAVQDCAAAAAAAQGVATAERNSNRGADVTYLQEVHIELLTGRTHQIRGQLAAVGYPIVGDALYHPAHTTNNEQQQQQQRLALECHRLAFVDPTTTDDYYRPSERWHHFDLSQQQQQPPWWCGSIVASSRRE